MHLERIVAHFIAGYLIAVGLLFGAASTIRIPYINVQPSGQMPVLVISAFFVVAGVGALYLLRKGKLKKEGVSIADVRQEAIEKMNDPKLLARIATQEPDDELRASAQDRLKELDA
ncbi:MAG: hypothetical protein PVJ44_23205 [Desulfobacterales bacterium]|jgi:hypothetical protein